MKITKSYLMQVIKEELGGSLGESVKKIVSQVESDYKSGNLDLSSLNNSLRLIERYFPQMLNSLEGHRKAEAQRVMADLKSQVSAYRGPTDLTRGIGGGNLSKQGMRDAYKGLAGSAAKKGLPAPTTSSVRAGNDQNEQQLSKIIGLFKTLGSLATSNGGYSEFSGGGYREPTSRGVNPQFVSGGSREVREHKITKSYLKQVIKEELETLEEIGGSPVQKAVKEISNAIEEIEHLVANEEKASVIKYSLRDPVLEYLRTAKTHLAELEGGAGELEEVSWSGIKKGARNAALGAGAAVGAFGSSAKADDYDDMLARNREANKTAYSTTSPSWEDSQKALKAQPTYQSTSNAQNSQAQQPEKANSATLKAFIEASPKLMALIKEKGSYGDHRVAQAYLASKNIADPDGTKASNLRGKASDAITQIMGVKGIKIPR